MHLSSQAMLAKKICETPHINEERLGLVARPYYPSNSGKCEDCDPGQKARPYLQNNQNQKGWRCD
jgi:hypothetical protein